MEEINNTSKLFLILLAVATVTVASVFVYWYFQKSAEPSKPFYTQLLEKNTEFAYAEGLIKSGKYDEATNYFKLALEKAEGYKEEGQLKYKIALSQGQGSNPIESIRLMKEIAANENYTPTIRAYAVQFMGHLLYSYNTLEVKDEVFKDEPYKSFLADDDYSLARRKLFEYASSFYPLGVSELRVAKWYSTEILKLVQGGVNEEATKNNIKEMKSIVRQKLVNADRYLRDITEDEHARSYIPEVWYRKGTVLGDMLLSGDTTFPDPEESYMRALEFSVVKTGYESTAKYSYAAFLAKMYGEKRANDIKSLLSDFYTGDKYEKTNTVRMITNEKNNLLGNKNDILLLAKIDDDFATFLKKLGWTL